MDPPRLNFLAGWTAMVLGIIAGAISGLSFHQERWLGGYGAFRRRMVRLAHISWFGLGFINLLFALSVAAADAPLPAVHVASRALAIGLCTMPLCCYLAAWKTSLRHLFVVPVLSVLIGIMAFLKAWVMR